MHHILLGLGAAFIAALIGAGWQVVTRLGVTTTVTPYDLALIRYAVPAVILLPLLWRKGFVPRGVHPLLIITILIGGGLPFGLLVMQGARFAPVSHIAVLIPGTMPLFVAALAAIFLAERITRAKTTGFALMLAGVACIGWEAVMTMGPTTVLGDLVLICAALLWGIYSVAFRKSGVSPWHGAALICFWSTLMALPLWLLQPQSGFHTTPATALMVQFLWQGILAGAVGMWIYGYAMQQVGASAAASVGALVPALAATGGWLVLGEIPSSLAMIGILVTILGVVCANTSAFDRKGR